MAVKHIYISIYWGILGNIGNIGEYIGHIGNIGVILGYWRSSHSADYKGSADALGGPALYQPTSVSADSRWMIQSVPQPMMTNSELVSAMRSIADSRISNPGKQVGDTKCPAAHDD